MIGTRTTCYRAVSLIGVVSTLLSHAEGRYQLGYIEGEGRKGRRREPADLTPLSLDDPDPSPPSLVGRRR
ncbi:hypothetical protein GW17_00062047 [Ensete ventricosum]|nr:hypothetical protein GW17_00062047 [Ensete ventricosum]